MVGPAQAADTAREYQRGVCAAQRLARIRLCKGGLKTRVDWHRVVEKALSSECADGAFFWARRAVRQEIVMNHFFGDIWAGRIGPKTAIRLAGNAARQARPT